MGRPPACSWERIYPFLLGNAFIGGLLNRKTLDNTVGRLAAPAEMYRIWGIFVGWVPSKARTKWLAVNHRG